MSMFESPVLFLVEPATVEEASEDTLVGTSRSSFMEASIAVIRSRSHSAVFQSSPERCRLDPVPNWLCEVAVDKETIALAEIRDPALEHEQMNREKTRQKPSVYERNRLT
jgi:hypothetical protein